MQKQHHKFGVAAVVSDESPRTSHTHTQNHHSLSALNSNLVSNSEDITQLHECYTFSFDYTDEESTVMNFTDGGDHAFKTKKPQSQETGVHRTLYC